MCISLKYGSEDALGNDEALRGDRPTGSDRPSRAAAVRGTDRRYRRSGAASRAAEISDPAFAGSDRHDHASNARSAHGIERLTAPFPLYFRQREETHLWSFSVVFRFTNFCHSFSRLTCILHAGARVHAERFAGPARCRRSSLHESYCTAGAVHTWLKRRPPLAGLWVATSSDPLWPRTAQCAANRPVSGAKSLSADPCSGRKMEHRRIASRCAPARTSLPWPDLDEIPNSSLFVERQAIPFLRLEDPVHPDRARLDSAEHLAGVSDLN